MPPLVCPSPNILDQSFPRSREELRLVVRALGRITEGIQQQQFVLILTPPIREFIMDASVFDWSKVDEFPELQTIFYTVANLGLQQAGVRLLDLSQVEDYEPHPVPLDCLDGLLPESWSDELGRLYSVHQESLRPGDQGFVGVACTHAFAQEPLGTYDNPENRPSFPLVGPGQIGELTDSEAYDVPDDVSRRTVTFSQAKARIHFLGGVVTKPRGGSHYQVKFSGARTWPLDYNHQEIPDQYLRELEPITRLDLLVIKYVLLEGRFPERKQRLKIPA